MRLVSNLTEMSRMNFIRPSHYSDILCLILKFKQTNYLIMNFKMAIWRNLVASILAIAASLTLTAQPKGLFSIVTCPAETPQRL